MNAVIYAKYYNSGNRDELSIENQVRICEEYAEKHNYRVIADYEDVTGERAEFQRMLQNSENHEFQVVIVSSFDRFAQDRYNSVYYKHKLKKNGVKVISAQEIITDDATGILMESILEGMAEYYANKSATKVS